MEGILSLLGLIIKITIMGFATFIVLHVLRSMKRRTLRDDIAKVEAKMAAYRINLKNRVKKKAKHFKASYPASITTGEPIDVSLSQLSELTFEKNTDFQDYIELCRKINNFIELAKVDKGVETPHEADHCDFMGTDFKNEINIVRLINDMVAVSKTLNKQVNRYNHFDRRAKMIAPEPINFTSLFELQKVFKNQHTSDELIERLPEDAKSAA